MPYIGNIVQDFSVNTAMLNTDSVTSIKIDDGTIVNADINASAAIQGTKISPNFGSQNIITTGTAATGNLVISDQSPEITLTESDTTTNGRFVTSGGQVFIQAGAAGSGSSGAGILNLTGYSNVSASQLICKADTVTMTSGLTVNTNTLKVDSANNRVGVGTASPSNPFHAVSTAATIANFQRDSSTSNVAIQFKNDTASMFIGLTASATGFAVDDDNNLSTGPMFFVKRSDGNVGIGTTSPDTLLHLAGEDTAIIRLENTDTSLGSSQLIGAIEFEKQDPTGAGVGIAGAIRLKSMSSVGQAASMFFTTSNSSGNDQTRMTIDFDGRVLIGGATSINASTNADDLQIGASGQSNQTGISLGSAVASSLRFMDVANDSAGFIFYNHTTDDMTIAATNSVTLSEAGTVRFSTHSNGVIISGFTDVRQDSTSTYSQTAAPGNLLARFYNGSAQDDSHTAIQLRASNDNGAADLWYMTCVSQTQNYNGALTFTARTTSSSYQELVRFANNGRVSMQVLALGSGNSHDSAKLVIQGTGNSTSTNSVFVKNSDETPLFQLRNDGAFFTGIDGTSPHNLTTSTNANLVVTSDGVLRRSTSSVRYKKDIADATFGLADVLKLKPKTFKNNATGEFADDKTYAGFTAEDIHDLGLTEFVQYNEANEPDALAYGNMVALLAKAIQDLNAKVEALEAK